MTPPARPYVTTPSATGRFVLRDIVIVDVTGGARTSGQDVETVDGVIARIGATGAVSSDVSVVDGGFVVPGFVDSHAHALNTPEQVDGAYALMLANGIVGFRQMSGSRELLARRATGQLPAPPGAPELLATPGSLLTPLNSSTPDAAVAAVGAQHEQGADFVKAGMMNRPALLAALTEARRLGLPVDGHLPGDVDPREAARAGMRCIEHLGPGVTVFAAACTCEQEIRVSPPRTIRLPSLRLPGMDRLVGAVLRRIVVNPAVTATPEDARQLEIADTTFDDERAYQLAALFAEHGTWHCPTLIRSHTQQFPDVPEHAADPRLRFIAPVEVARWRKSARRFAKLPERTRQAQRAHWPTQLRLTKILADAGVRLLAGTDANGAGWVIPGSRSTTSSTCWPPPA